MLAVMYDKATGIIYSVMRGAPSTIALNGDYIEIQDANPLPDYCNHYKVVDGAIVEKDDEEKATLLTYKCNYSLDLSKEAQAAGREATDDDSDAPAA